jgi:hypothetical protein
VQCAWPGRIDWDQGRWQCTGTDSCVVCEHLCNGWRFEKKGKNCPSFWPVYWKSYIPLHPALTSRKCCCYYVQYCSSVKLFLVGVWMFYVCGRVNRNVSTAASVNGQGMHMPNGCKAVEPIHSERITVVSKCRPSTLIQSVEQLEVHYVNSFFAILPTVFHRSLCAADANLMLQNTKVSFYLEKNISDESCLSLALYFIPVSTDCMMSRFYRKYIFTITYILASQRSLNAIVAQSKNCPFVVNTTVELRNIKRLHSTKTALSTFTGVLFNYQVCQCYRM